MTRRGSQRDRDDNLDLHQFLDHPDDATMSFDQSADGCNDEKEREGGEWDAEDKAIRHHSHAPVAVSSRAIKNAPSASHVSFASARREAIDVARMDEERSAGGGGGGGMRAYEGGGMRELAARNVDLSHEIKALEKEIQQLKDALSGSSTSTSTTNAMDPTYSNDSSVSMNRLRGMNGQLQRQVTLMSEELRGCSDLVLEAEGVMEETSRRMEALIGSPGIANPLSLPRDGGAGGGGGGGGEAIAVDLHRFARQMLTRIKSERSQAARKVARSGIEERRRREDEEGQRRGLGASDLNISPCLRYEVPFVPAGGNRFLACLDPSSDQGLNSNPNQPPPPPPHSSSPTRHVLSLSDIVQGRGGGALMQLLALSSGSQSSPGGSSLGYGLGGRPSSPSPSRALASNSPSVPFNSPESAARASSEIQGENDCV